MRTRTEAETQRLRELDDEIAEADAQRIVDDAQDPPDSRVVSEARTRLKQLFAARHELLGEEANPDDVL